MGRYDVKSESFERVSRLRVDGLKRLTLLASRPERVRCAKLGACPGVTSPRPRTASALR